LSSQSAVSMHLCMHAPAGCTARQQKTVSSMRRSWDKHVTIGRHTALQQRDRRPEPRMSEPLMHHTTPTQISTIS
jgi:hypothetical protein